MQFINPYNFISLSDEPERSEENNWRNRETASKEELLTGVIEYTLTTRSRLHIPNTSTDTLKDEDKNKEHKYFNFYSYPVDDGENSEATGLNPGEVYARKGDQYYAPVIPGSEVRGMLRTVYETLTNSCLPVIDGETRIGKRTIEQFKPGVLIRNRGMVYLYEAEDFISRNSKDFSKMEFLSERMRQIPDGSRVYFQEKERNNRGKNFALNISTRRTTTAPTEGYLMKGEKGPEISPQKSNDKRCEKCPNYAKNPDRISSAPICTGSGLGNKNQTCYLSEKHCVHVFVRKTNNGHLIDEATLKELGIIIKQYQSNAKNAEEGRKSEYTEYENAYQDFMNQNRNALPVYHSKLYDERYMLSPACITREVYRHTEKDVVKKYRKCGSKQKDDGSTIPKEKVPLCAACSLFGIVSETINTGSRIRFSDLQVQNAEAYRDNYKACYDEEWLTLEELSAPKISATEFYLKKPDLENSDILFWTYDYYIVKTPHGAIVKPYTPDIAGRKFYWHNCTDITSADKKNNRNRTVRTVKAGIEFKGSLYFDGITKRELKQLLYILSYTSDGDHGYKLGTGKPLGLGSVELMAVSVNLRKFSEMGYETQTYQIDDCKEVKKQCENEGFDDNVKSEFELMTRYMSKSNEQMIHYPIVNQKEDKGYEWFMKNKVKNKSYSNSRTEVTIKESLPNIKGRKEPPVMGK